MSLNKRISPFLNKININSVSPVIYRFVSKTTEQEEEVTHTGQKWELDDYRRARFMHAPKLVNQNWAVKLIEAIPPRKVHKRVVWCDGGSGPEGHPRVYINLDKPGIHACGYCGLRFEQIH